MGPIMLHEPNQYEDFQKVFLEQLKTNTGIIAKDETSETTVRNFYCPFLYKDGSIHL